MDTEHQVPIWFFVGGTLLIYGLIILGAGLYALVDPSQDANIAMRLPARRYLVGRVHGGGGRVLHRSLLSPPQGRQTRLSLVPSPAGRGENVVPFPPGEG